MSKNSSPARLNMTDLPRDNQHCLGSLRKALVASANYCKRYPVKRMILLRTLAAVYKYLDSINQAEEDLQKAAEDALAEAKALAQKESEEAAEAKLALLALENKQKAAKA